MSNGRKTRVASATDILVFVRTHHGVGAFDESFFPNNGFRFLALGYGALRGAFFDPMEDRVVDPRRGGRV